jgi:hypothetical protein
VYATGNPIARVRSVASPPYRIEFENCRPNWLIAVT